MPTPLPTSRTSTHLRDRNTSAPRVTISTRIATLLSMMSMMWSLSVAPPGRCADNQRPSEPSSPEAWYGETIRSAAWRSPEEELKGFHVPEGFSVELVVAEPRILKPMNLAFDRQGRLWCTESVQYPFPASGPRGSDSISLHTDTDGDGTFETSRVFVDGLNIPIGLLPYEDGVIAFTIPNIEFFRDTNGDGVCDERRKILGPFDTSRDTHGMVNALRDGGDGWIYACHGFNNISKLSGTDGHTIELTSGNVFRFRPDGSRVEQYTQGQVNPFGMTRDGYGTWFTADCHSKPITQLLRGGCYPSFGRPHDGLGFLPPTMDHLHGSTAISGIAHVAGEVFPEAFRGNLLSGNVMTCRINRNRIEYRGATARAIELPDLLTSDDPWFRPVDLQFGPDGNLYIADFYNRIIGHYEVPLDHPLRDRTSGRIWRIRPPATKATAAVSSPRNATASQPATRAVEPMTLASAVEMVRRTDVPASDTAKALARIGAIETLGDLGTMSHIPLLLDSMKTVDEAFDPFLKQSHRIAMRDIVGRSARSGQAFPTGLLEGDAQTLAQQSETLLQLLRAVREPSAARWSMDILESIGDRLPDGWNTPFLRDSVLHLSTVAADADTPRVLQMLERVTPDTSSRSELVLRVAESQKERNGRIAPSLLGYGASALSKATADWNAMADATPGVTQHAWSSRATAGAENKPWPLESRRMDLGGGRLEPEMFWSSFGLGERYLGTWTSSPVPAPESLGFWIVGHDGLPSDPALKTNYVRILVVDERTGEWNEVHRIPPPRSDFGQSIRIDLKPYVGRRMRLQVVDGNGHDSYAWIGIADVSIPGLGRSPLRDGLDSIRRIVQCFGPSWMANRESPEIASILSDWSQWIERPNLDAACKVSLQKPLMGSEAPIAAELVELLVERGWEDLLHETPGTREVPLPAYRWDWMKLDGQSLQWIADRTCQRSNATDQEALAVRWSRHRSAIPFMESLIRRGVMSKEVLRAMPPAWWDGLSPEDASRLADLRPEGEMDTTRAQVVAQRAQAVRAITPDLQIGARVFTERCAACHQLAGQGKLVGPQLDGAITRTIDRLCEDILWPNRNVDEAFRITNVLMESGETHSGLIVDRQNDTLELIDSAGKSLRLPRSDVEGEKISRLSLMPSNLEELISDAELASLIGYLKSKVPDASR